MGVLFTHNTSGSHCGWSRGSQRSEGRARLEKWRGWWQGCWLKALRDTHSSWVDWKALQTFWVCLGGGVQLVSSALSAGLCFGRRMPECWGFGCTSEPLILFSCPVGVSSWAQSVSHFWLLWDLVYWRTKALNIIHCFVGAGDVDRRDDPMQNRVEKEGFLLSICLQGPWKR